MITKKDSKSFSVSVVVTVYNVEMYLEQCLDSLLKQTIDSLQIVCVDDGSTDSSAAILDKYAKKYKHIKVIRQENKGLGGARNTGIDNSDGEYIGFVDADDYVDPEMFEKLYNLATKNDCEIAMCNVEFEPKHLTKKHLWYKPYKGIIDGAFLDRNVQPTNKIVSRKLIERLNFRFFKKNGDDMYIILMLQSRGIISTNEKMYHYRVGHNTMSNTFKVESFLNFIACTKEQIKQAKKYNKYDNLREYFDYRMIYVLIQTLSVAALKSDKGIFDECRKKLKEYNYKRNKYVRTLLRNEFSRIEFFCMINILPRNYIVSSLLVKIKLRGWK